MEPTTSAEVSQRTEGSSDAKIRYFATIEEFKAASVDPQRQNTRGAVRVQPGLLSVEAYEAILRQQLGREIEFEVLIARPGICNATRNTPRGRANTWIERASELGGLGDVLFIKPSGSEFFAIHEWMLAHGFGYCPTNLATPAGLVSQFAWTGCSGAVSPEELSQRALADLGLEASDFRRSLLPPGAMPTPLISCQAVWHEPAVDSPELHGDTWKDLRRVEWPLDAAREI